MKRRIALLLSLAMLLPLLTACGDKTITNTEETVETVADGEEQEARTGIRLYAPLEMENPEWLVVTGSDGGTMAQVDFDYNGDKWHYRAEKTDRTEDSR